MIYLTSFYFGIRALNGVLGLISIYALTRLLNADQYGTYALGLAGVNFLAAILFQWLNAGASRLYPSYVASQNDFLHEVLLLFKISSGAGVIVFTIWLAFRPTSAISGEMSAVILLTAIAMGFYNLQLHIHNSSQQILHYGVLSTSRAAFVLFFVISAALAGFGSLGALLGVMFGSILAAILFGYRTQQTSQAKKGDVKIRIQIAKFGIPLFFTYAATMVIDFSDRFLIGWLYGPSSVGGYSASYDLAQQTVGVILNVFYLVLFPKIVTAWEKEKIEDVHLHINHLTKVTFLAAGASAGVFIGLSADITHFMLGSELRGDAELVMPWIASAIAIGCLKSYLLDIALQLERRTKTLLYITLGMAIFNLLLNLVLLPKFGILGSAVSTLAAFSMGAIMSIFLTRRINIIGSINSDIAKTVFSIVIMVIYLRWLSELWPISIIALSIKICSGLIVFAMVSFLINTAGLRDLCISKIKFKKVL